MAGRLPGVGLPPRRRSSEHNNHRHEHHVTTYRESYLREESLDFESPWSNNSVSALDETALKARQRLQKKLGYFFSSSRSNENPKKEGKVSESSFQKKDAGLGRKILESSWLLGGKQKEKQICAVCLENFQQDEKVMNLSCSHKYHSACLLPWLAVHPHCPYCRTLVENLLNKTQPKHH